MDAFDPRPIMVGISENNGIDYISQSARILYADD